MLRRRQLGRNFRRTKRYIVSLPEVYVIIGNDPGWGKKEGIGFRIRCACEIHIIYGNQNDHTGFGRPAKGPNGCKCLFNEHY